MFYASYIHLVVRGPPGTNTHHRVLRLLRSPCGQRASWYQHSSPCFTPLTFTSWSEGLLVPTHITVFYASYIHLVVRGPPGTNTHHRVLHLLHSPCGQRASWYQHTSPCFTPLTFTLWSEGRRPPGTNTHHRVLRLLHSPCGQRVGRLLVPTLITVFYASYIHLVASWYQHTSPCFTPLTFTSWSEGRRPPGTNTHHRVLRLLHSPRGQRVGGLLVPTHITVFYASYIHLVVRG